MSGENSDDDASQLMRQKLMSADEVYLYKIPPLKDAGGHRCVCSYGRIYPCSGGSAVMRMGLYQ